MSTFSFFTIILNNNLNLSGNDLVITAAHCVDGASKARVILGAYDFGEEEPGRVEISSQEIIIHPSWSPSTLTNDVALIKLTKSVEFSKTTSEWTYFANQMNFSCFHR